MEGIEKICQYVEYTITFFNYFHCSDKNKHSCISTKILACRRTPILTLALSSFLFNLLYIIAIWMEDLFHNIDYTVVTLYLPTKLIRMPVCMFNHEPQLVWKTYPCLLARVIMVVFHCSCLHTSNCSKGNFLESCHRIGSLDGNKDVKVARLPFFNDSRSVWCN